MFRNRAAVKRRLTELATYALADLLIVDPDPDIEDDEGRTVTFTIRYSWDGGVVNQPTCFLGVTDGRTDPAGIKRNNERTNDRYTINGYIAVPGFTTDDAGGKAAEEAAERALNALDAVIRASTSLVNSDIESAMEPAAHRVSTVTIGDVSGPYHGFPDPNSSASFSGGVTFVIDCLHSTSPPS